MKYKHIGIIPGTRNFSWEEATRNGDRPIQAVTYGGKTFTAEQVEANVINIATWAQRLRNEMSKSTKSISITITSWFRPPAVNRAVGGASLSYHQNGSAMDIRVNGSNIEDTVDALIAINFPGGIGVNTAANFVHIDLGPARTFTYGNAKDATLVDRIKRKRGR